MVFSSPLFVFAFLPITVILYCSLGKNFRNIVLLIASLLFYAWGEPVYVFLMCGSIIINYGIGTFLGRDNTSRKRKLLLIISILFNIGCLAYFKYLCLLINAMASMTLMDSWNLNVEIPSLPIGISFYTFQILSYVIDVYKGKVKPQKSLILFALYITMFPQLVAGPIVNYGEIESQLAKRSINFKNIYSGMGRFLCGLAKKVLLANSIGLLWSEIKAMPDTEITVLMAWAGIIAFALQIYFDFSGYSDMAIGLGKMLGFSFKENFRYPYISQSISEFWRRWHISLGSWFKEYVYIPLGGSQVSKWKMISNLLIVWFLTGLWHGASWNFVLWGLYFGTLILIEKLFLLKSMKQWPIAIRHIYLLFFVVIGWVFFEFTNLEKMLSFLQSMFGLGSNVAFDSHTIINLKGYAFLYAVCIIAATPWPKKVTYLLKKTNLNIYKVVERVYYCVLMFLGVAYMVGSTYNPFIYFRF